MVDQAALRIHCSMELAAKCGFWLAQSRSDWFGDSVASSSNRSSKRRELVGESGGTGETAELSSTRGRGMDGSRWIVAGASQ
jgi:hypothetical protein